MKKPVPQIQKTIFQVRYKPKLKFYELLYPVASKLTEYPHWETDRLRVLLRDYDKRCSLGIGYNNFAYEQDSSDSEMEQDRIKQAINILVEGLEIETCLRLGFRRFYLLPIEFPFDSLVAIIFTKLFIQEEKLRKLLPAKIDDLMYRIDFTEDNYRLHLTLGPVQKKQVPELVQFNPKHLNPETAQQDLLEIVKKYPDIAIFLDIDFYQEENDIPINNIAPFYLQAKERVHQLAEKISDYLLIDKLED